VGLTAFSMEKHVFMM